MFFVLSGYLITSLLVTEQEQLGRIDLRAFWFRRITRLAPALLCVVAMCMVPAPRVTFLAAFSTVTSWANVFWARGGSLGILTQHGRCRWRSSSTYCGRWRCSCCAAAGAS